MFLVLVHVHSFPCIDETVTRMDRTKCLGLPEAPPSNSGALRSYEARKTLLKPAMGGHIVYSCHIIRLLQGIAQGRLLHICTDQPYPTDDVARI